MDEAKRKWVGQWILKAEHDLKTAIKMSEGDDPVLDIAIYHCQQCGEKLLKGYLSFLDLRFEKTHDLGVLGDAILKVDPQFSKLFEQLDELSPYATLYRYPGDQEVPTREEFQSALSIAQSAFQYIRAKISTS